MEFIAYSILEILKPYEPVVVGTLEEDRQFSDIALLPNEDKPELDIKTLYLSMQPTFRRHSDRYTGVCVVCSDDRRKMEAEECTDCTYIVLDARADMAAVTNLLLGYKTRLWSWHQDLMCSVATGKGMQDLLDRSEFLFHDPIIIMSKTLRVLAYTRHIPASHEDIAQTLRDGYFPKHMIQGLVEKQYLQAAEQYYTIGYHYPPNYVNCTKIIKVFQDNALQIHTICLYGLSQSPTPTTMHYMKVLVSFLEQLIEKAGKPKDTFEKRNICLLVDIIEKDLSEKEINSKAKLMEWPYSCEYRVCLVHFEQYYYPYVQFVTNCLQNDGMFFAIFLYQEKIIALEIANRREPQSNSISHFQELFQDNAAYCGKSCVFSRLQDFKCAFEQASTAARLGRCLHPETVIYPYESYFPYQLLETSGQIQWLSSRLLNALKADEKSDSNDQLILLESLLRNERNITAVAHEMNMHRNTVLYRIGKLQERMHVSLEDPDMRFMLHLALKARELCDVKKNNAEA